MAVVRSGSVEEIAVIRLWLSRCASSIPVARSKKPTDSIQTIVTVVRSIPINVFQTRLACLPSRQMVTIERSTCLVRIHSKSAIGCNGLGNRCSESDEFSGAMRVTPSTSSAGVGAAERCPGLQTNGQRVEDGLSGRSLALVAADGHSDFNRATESIW